MLSTKQRGVLKGMIAGMSAALAIVIGGSWLDPFALGDSGDPLARLRIAIEASVLPAALLVLSVGRLARHRFFTPQDIDGGGISTDSERALVLQTLLQNTLEQFCIAMLAYLAWAVVMPVAWLSVPWLAALAFAAGRILFFTGYHRGAPARALGFALTFYPSVLMLACVLARLAWTWLG